MAEDSLPNYIKEIMNSGITVEKQKLIRDVLFEIYHLPLEDEDDDEETCERKWQHLL